MITLGVFDSGVGGLSVLRELLAQLPGVQCVYLADNAFAPYGEREVSMIQARSAFATDYLRKNHQIDAMVIACNTATAHAIDGLRLAHPDLPFIGVEPAIKPAGLQSRSGHIGVLATRATLASARYAKLQSSTKGLSSRSLNYFDVPCDGLADAIEKGDGALIESLSQKYISNLLNASHEASQVDTVVLGCTHYPFALSALEKASPPHITFIDTGIPVARRVKDLLAARHPAPFSHSTEPQPLLFSTGPSTAITVAARRWIAPSLMAQSLLL